MLVAGVSGTSAGGGVPGRKAGGPPDWNTGGGDGATGITPLPTPGYTGWAAAVPAPTNSTATPTHTRPCAMASPPEPQCATETVWDGT